MAKKTVSQIFAGVDPNLKVIDGGRRHDSRRKRAKKLSEVANPVPEPYNPKPLTEEEWEKAKGVICPICGDEVMRLFPYGFTGRKKACKGCIDKRTKLLEYKARLMASRFRRR